MSKKEEVFILIFFTHIKAATMAYINTRELVASEEAEALSLSLVDEKLIFRNHSQSFSPLLLLLLQPLLFILFFFIFFKYLKKI